MSRACEANGHTASHRSLTLALAAALTCLPSVASAHPLVDGGRRLFEEAEFQSALDLFERAEAASDLELADLALLYESRALVHRAMGNAEASDADLTRLASIDPGHQFDRGVPPDMVEAFAAARSRLRGRLRIDVDVRILDEALTISAETVLDAAALVRELRVSARLRGGEWRTARNTTLQMAVPGGGVTQYYAEAIGPGGAILARTGSRTEPERAVVPPPASGGSAGLWIGIGLGAAAVIAGIIVAIVLLSQPSDGDLTQVNPTVRW